MLSKLFGKLEKRRGEKEEKRLRGLAQKVSKLEWTLSALTDAKLDEEVAAARERLATMFDAELAGDAKRWAAPAISERPETISAAAAIREVTRRTLGLRLHDEQIMGAFALREGRLAEMKTGEGKTLVAMTAAALDALAGLPCHVVTVNDYLARRDALELGETLSRLGLKTGLLQDGQGSEEKRRAYACDVVYGVNHEFGFDYLRDRTATERGERRQRVLGSAIVDEVDSILIDEARTPLILSGQANEDLSAYPLLASLCRIMPKKFVEADEKNKVAHLSEEGFEWFEEHLTRLGVLEHKGELYEFSGAHLAKALQATMNAWFVFRKDVDYIVSKSEEIVIIDDRTGRAMEGRRWSDGLHQAVEAKEGVEVRQENRTLASVTYQNFFRLYGKLSGLTGTAMTQAAEFWDVYGLECIEIPTNKPVQRVDLEDLVYRTAAEKFEAIAEEIREAKKRGQPVLVGTATVEDSERLSELLNKEGLAHEVLNAKQHEREALIIEMAGRPGAVTVATNMAGRGTDVELGGSRKAMRREAETKGWTQDEVDILEHEWKRAHEKVKKAGGLYVIGAARNESRRVDLQLRGRAGRQGDPGRSRFYVSLEDDLFRVYGDNPFLKRLARGEGWPHGVPLEHSMMTKALERAQRQVEGLHAAARGRLMDYDEAGNHQRKAYYGWREEFLDMEDPMGLIGEFVAEAVERSIMRDSEGIDALPEDWTWERTAELCRAATGGLFEPERFGEERLDEWEWSAQKAAAALGKEAARFFEKALTNETREDARTLTLSRMDGCWQTHLTGMSEMMTGIHLRSYAQADPRKEFKLEAFKRFKAMREAMADDCTRDLGAWLLERMAFEESARRALLAELESMAV